MRPLARYTTLFCAAGLCTVLLLAQHPSAADDDAKPADSSVLVETRPATQGELPERLVAYGSAEPAADGRMTLSIPAEGRVTRLLVTAGEAVHRGQALLEFHLSAAATSALAQARSALRVAREEQTRTARLLEQQLATRDQKAQADKAAGDAQAALYALERENGGKVEQTLTAPFDGVIDTIPVAQGERVAAGAALATLVRHNGLVVTVGIEPADVGRVHPQEHADVASLGASPRRLPGTVVRVDHTLNPRTRLVDTDIAVDGDVLQGDAFQARIETGRLKGWVLPRAAVLDDEAGPYLFQLDGTKAVRVGVQRLGGDDHSVVVSGPLDPRREVVVVGNYQLEDGASVRKAAATRATTPP